MDKKKFKVQCRNCGYEYTYIDDYRFNFCEECGDLEYDILEEIYNNEKENEK